MQHNKYRKILWGSLMFLIIFSWNIVQAESTPEAGVQVSPIRLDWELESGEQKTGEIIVHNFSDISHDVEVQVEDFFVSNDSQQANFYIPGSEHPLKAYDVINWIDAPENFTLAPGETKKLVFTVTVPGNQPTNGYYGSIFFKTNTSSDTIKENVDGINLDVNYRVGVLLTLAVQGDEQKKIDGYVENFDVIKKVFWKNPITISAKLKSSGNIHYKAGGKIEVKKFGKRFAVIKVNDEIMYPDRERTFRERIMFDVWDYGIYNAKLNMQSEDGSVIFDSEEITFFVIPWKPIAVIIISLFLIGIVWKIFNRRFVIVKRTKK